MVYVVLKVLYSFFEATVKPVTAWDSFVFHLLKSKAFYIAKAVNPKIFDYIGGGVGYPLNIPLNVSWIYECIGTWNDAIGQIVFPMFLLCLVVIFYCSLMRYASRLQALAGIFILVSLPLPFFHSTISYLDLPVAVYSACAAIFLYNYLRSGNPRYVLLASVLSGIGIWTKNEGQMYFAINAVIFGIFMLMENPDKPKKIAALLAQYVLIPPIVFFLPWTLFKSLNYIAFSLQLGRAEHINYLERVVPVFNVCFQKLFIDGNWNIFWFIFVLVVIFRFPSIIKERSSLLLAIILSNVLFYYIYYLTASSGIYGWVFDGTLICRNFISFTVLAVFLVSCHLFQPADDGKKIQ